MPQPSSLDLSDDDFLAAFDHGDLGRYAFPHRAHLRLAWLCVRRLGVGGAIDRITAGIRRLTEGNGQPGLYHDTLTRAWVYMVADACVTHPDISDFNQFLDACPELLDKNLLLRYYSPQRLSSQEARVHWIGPDLQTIPGAPASNTDGLGPKAVPEAVSMDEFRRMMAHIPLPVAVMAAHDATRVHGMTVSSVATVAREPAMVVACVGRESRTLEVVRAAGGYAVSFLAAGQVPIAARFADRTRGEDSSQFRGIPHRLGPFGAPIINGGAAWLECRLSHEFEVGEHRVVCGTVIAVGTGDTQPLQRFRDTWV